MAWFIQCDGCLRMWKAPRTNRPMTRRLRESWTILAAALATMDPRRREGPPGAAHRLVGVLPRPVAAEGGSGLILAPRRTDPAFWEERLAAEGLPRELPTALEELTGSWGGERPGRVHGRQPLQVRIADTLEWDRVVRGYLRRNRWARWPSRHKTIWQLYCDQVPMSAIGRVVRRSASTVHGIISRHLERALRHRETA